MRMATEITPLTDLEWINEELKVVPVGTDIEISKQDVPALPKEFKVTLWGDPLDAEEQYRYGKIFIREYRNKWLARMNRFDPDEDPIDFLMNDAPEMLAAFTVGAGSGLTAGRLIYEVKEKAGEGGDIAKLESAMAGLAVGLITGAGAYFLGREVRKPPK